MMKQIKTKSGDVIILYINEQIPINRPDGIILGKLSELTDKDCEEFVDYSIKGLTGENTWRDYNFEEWEECYSAKESFISLLQSEGIDTSKEYLIIRIL